MSLLYKISIYLRVRKKYKLLISQEKNYCWTRTEGSPNANAIGTVSLPFLVFRSNDGPADFPPPGSRVLIHQEAAAQSNFIRWVA